MNYRHAFHAGNFADVTKHALLLALVTALQKKDGGITILDTHAGRGIYDLLSEQAGKTEEWRQGIGQLVPGTGEASGDLTPSLAPYWRKIRQFGFPSRYPGSPALMASTLRPQDRLICSELHAEEYEALAHFFRRNAQVSVHHSDGYQSVKAFLPPRDNRRGLVLIDPPFEKTNEFDRLKDAIMLARRRFPTCVVAAWYPVKHRAPVRDFQDGLQETGLKKILACELMLRSPLDPARLNGNGFIIVNAPYLFDKTARDILNDLLPLLSHETSAESSVHWISGE